MTATTTTTKKMTAREFFTAISEYDLPTDLLDYAENEIKKLDDAKERRKATPSKKQQENAPIRQALLDYLVANLSDEYFSQAELGAALGITPNKAGALARQLVAEGVVENADVRVDGKTRKGYRAIGERE